MDWSVTRTSIELIRAGPRSVETESNWSRSRRSVGQLAVVATPAGRCTGGELPGSDDPKGDGSKTTVPMITGGPSPPARFNPSQMFRHSPLDRLPSLRRVTESRARPDDPAASVPTFRPRASAARSGHLDLGMGPDEALDVVEHVLHVAGILRDGREPSPARATDPGIDLGGCDPVPASGGVEQMAHDGSLGFNDGFPPGGSRRSDRSVHGARSGLRALLTDEGGCTVHEAVEVLDLSLDDVFEPRRRIYLSRSGTQTRHHRVDQLGHRRRVDAGDRRVVVGKEKSSVSKSPG